MIPAFGAQPSKYDVRTFTYPTKAYTKQTGGKRYPPEVIENQSKVGICTSISLTQNAKMALGKPFSAEFQYLMQKLNYDRNQDGSINWDEGSSIFSAVKVAKNIGLLPAEHWTFTTEADRDLPYDQYLVKLRAVPAEKLQELKDIAADYKIKAYASVPVNRDAMAQAIDESKAGILSRYVLGVEWYSDVNGNITWNKAAIQPLRPPKRIISGHAVTDTNYDGRSFRIANTWSKEWADGGTAYRLQQQYAPTECWAVFYNDAPPEIDKKLENRQKIIGQIMDYLQKIIELLPGLA